MPIQVQINSRTSSSSSLSIVSAAGPEVASPYPKSFRQELSASLRRCFDHLTKRMGQSRLMQRLQNLHPAQRLTYLRKTFAILQAPVDSSLPLKNPSASLGSNMSMTGAITFANPFPSAVTSGISASGPDSVHGGNRPASFQDRVTGSIVGGAIGDALGHPVEFWNLQQIRRVHGPEGLKDFTLVRSTFSAEPLFLPGTYTDDTQMTLAIANALVETRAGRHGDLAKSMSDHFIRWLGDKENNRAPGASCLKGCENLKSGLPWYMAGTHHSKGCGAVMRVAPIGIVFHQQPQSLDEVAAFSAILTHRHPTAYASAIAGARLVAAALRTVSPEEFKRTAIDAVVQDLPANGREVVQALQKIPEAMTMAPDEAFAHLGEGWVAEEALAGALYAVLSTSSYEEAVLRAANTAGDSDSLASIAGNIAGALYGIQGIPEKWVRDVENSEQLKAISSSLATLAEEISNQGFSERVIKVDEINFNNFPEVQRALQDPQASLDLFIMMVDKTLATMEPAFGHDFWLDPMARFRGQVYIEREVKDRLVKSKKAEEAEFISLDTMIHFFRFHKALLLNPQLSLTARLALGIINSPVIDPMVQDEYAFEVNRWIARNNLNGNRPYSIPDAAIRDFEDKLKQKYPEWRTRLKTQDWAVEYIRKHQPGWIEELNGLNGLQNESVPKKWHSDYEKFIVGFHKIHEPSVKKLGWVSPLVEWYFVGHAFFIQQHQEPNVN